ncbi:MAG TPA: STAS domain-containing protein [Vicinamibacterales bacterium]|nr:STAS domain-containing protein [Vicinamibacterales bacterium]
MRIDERNVDGVVVLDLHGRIAAGDGAIKETIDALTSSGVKRVVINFSDVPYMDSVGLSVLVRARLTMGQRGGELKLACLPKHLADLLRLTRLSTVFETFDDETAAIRSFAGV